MLNVLSKNMELLSVARHTAGFFVAYSKMPNWNMNPLRFLNECRNPKAFA